MSQPSTVSIPKVSPLKRLPLVSVIIPTKNSQSTLAICLESIRRQTYDNIEILIVDSSSKDDTKGIAEKYGARVINHDSKMAAARNEGAKFAKGEYIFHMDSDMKLTCHVIQECVETLQNGVHAAIIPQIYDGQGFFGKCRALEFKCLIGDPLIKSSRFMTRIAFDSVGGYDCSLDAGEDWDITQKIEVIFKVGCIHNHLVHGWGKYNLTKTMQKSYNYGKTVKLYMSKYPEYSRHQWGPLRLKHLNYNLLRDDALHALGLAFMKFCEFATGWLGMIIA